MRAINRIAGIFTTAGFWLWTVQLLLAALYLFAGGFKAFGPAEMLMQNGGSVQFPLAFIRFIGFCELAGALGLILPTLLRIQPRLTPLAASGLVIIMIGATTLMLIEGGVPMAIMPFVAGALATFVAYGRTQLAPVQARRAVRVPVLTEQAA
jgi:putative oxidoreductase